MHWTLGILRHFQAFSTPEQNPALEVLSRPAPAPVTQTVRRLFRKQHDDIAKQGQYSGQVKPP